MTRSSDYCHRGGLALVEVAAGTTLLAVLLVAVLTAASRHVRQIRMAHRQQIAIEMTDRFLADMMSGSREVLVPAQGSFPGDAGLTWTTSLVKTSVAGALKLSIIRFDVIDSEQSIRDVRLPLVSIELAVPKHVRREGDARDE